MSSREAEPTMSWAPVYRLVKRIPRGRVMTYGQLARALRLRGGARAARPAIAACPAGRGIPLHRVVRAGGGDPLRGPPAGGPRPPPGNGGTPAARGGGGGGRAGVEVGAWSVPAGASGCASRTRRCSAGYWKAKARG